MIEIYPNLIENLLIEFLDEDGKWKPITTVPITPTGDFDQYLSLSEGGFQFPINEETIMRLTYLPTELTNYSNEVITVDYSSFNPVYVNTQNSYELFTLFVEGKESRIKRITTDFSQSVDNSATVLERKYVTTTNPYEALHEGEPYTILDFHKTITDEYDFMFQLTDATGKFLPDQPVWIEIGWKPKAGLNYKIIDWENEDGNYLDSETLGTAWFMDEGQEVCLGPGVEGVKSRLFNRPETWKYLDPETGEVGEYSSYYYDYCITDTNGIVTFNVSFDEDYIGDHHRIFDESVFSSGSITFDSMDDYRLYIRVWHAPVYDIGDMALSNSDDLLCSQGNNVFDWLRIFEFDNYSLESIGSCAKESKCKLSNSTYVQRSCNSIFYCPSYRAEK